MPENDRAVVAGVDGCRGGWVVVQAFAARGRGLRVAGVQVVPTFADVLGLTGACTAVAADMPIGFSDDGCRAADYEARRRIGPRRSSVFPPPARSLLAAEGDYACLNRLSRAACQRGLSRQTYNILPRMREIDLLMSPQMQDRVVEAHPEVSFWALNGQRALRHAKLTGEGYQERLAILAAAYGSAITFAPPRGCARDDLLDAAVLAWTAARLAAGTACHLPAEPEYDARGLRMEIVY